MISFSSRSIVERHYLGGVLGHGNSMGCIIGFIRYRYTIHISIIYFIHEAYYSIAEILGEGDRSNRVGRLATSNGETQSLWKVVGSWKVKMTYMAERRLEQWPSNSCKCVG
jgi:hypothetical protein